MTRSKPVFAVLAILLALSCVLVWTGALPSPASLLPSERSPEESPDSAEAFEWPDRATRSQVSVAEAIETGEMIFPVSAQDGSGEPLEGVTVTLFAWDEEKSLYATDVRAQTDRMGEAQLKPVAGHTYEGSDGFTFSAEKDGYATVVDGFYHPDAGCGFRLFRGCAISGRIIDLANHEPVRGARVIFGEEFEYAGGPNVVGPVETVTDAEGRYRYEFVAPSRQEVITVRRDGYQKQQFVESVGEGPEHHADLFLSAGLTLTGRIFDGETGTPLEGVGVRQNVRIDTTDEHGRFVARGLTGQATHLIFKKKSYCYAWLFGPAEELGEVKERRIPMFRSSTITGNVVDATGEPIARAPVEVETLDPFTMADPLMERYPGYDWDFFNVRPGREGGVTDEEGRFRVSGLKARSHPIRIHTRHPKLDAAVHSEWIELTSFGETREIELRHELGATIGGVIRPSGVPWRVSWTGSSTTGTADADLDGSYTLRGVESGPVRVNVLWPGRSETDEFSPSTVLSSSTVAVQVGDDLRHDIQMDVDPHATLTTGTVLGPDGGVRSGVSVEMCLPLQRVSTSSDDQGRFGFEATGEPGLPIQLVFGSADRLQVEVQAEVGNRDIAVVVPESAKVRLLIVDDVNGLPVPGAVVSWTCPVGASRERASGTFSWRPTNRSASVVRLPIGVIGLTVEADLPNYLPTTMEDFLVEGSEATVVIRLIPSRDAKK